MKAHPGQAGGGPRNIKSPVHSTMHRMHESSDYVREGRRTLGDPDRGLAVGPVAGPCANSGSAADPIGDAGDQPPAGHAQAACCRGSFRGLRGCPQASTRLLSVSRYSSCRPASFREALMRVPHRRAVRVYPQVAGSCPRSQCGGAGSVELLARSPRPPRWVGSDPARFRGAWLLFAVLTMGLIVECCSMFGRGSMSLE